MSALQPSVKLFSHYCIHLSLFASFSFSQFFFLYPLIDLSPFSFFPLSSFVFFSNFSNLSLCSLSLFLSLLSSPYTSPLFLLSPPLLKPLSSSLWFFFLSLLSFLIPLVINSSLSLPFSIFCLFLTHYRHHFVVFLSCWIFWNCKYPEFRRTAGVKCPPVVDDLHQLMKQSTEGSYTPLLASYTHPPLTPRRLWCFSSPTPRITDCLQSTSIPSLGLSLFPSIPYLSVFLPFPLFSRSSFIHSLFSLCSFFISCQYTILFFYFCFPLLPLSYFPGSRGDDLVSLAIIIIFCWNHSPFTRLLSLSFLIRLFILFLPSTLPCLVPFPFFHPISLECAATWLMQSGQWPPWHVPLCLQGWGDCNMTPAPRWSERARVSPLITC